MTVFKGFLIITKRNLLMVFMYLAIFLTIGILASGSDSNTSGSGFHAQALTVGVVDHDGGVLSKGLSTYLSQYHTIRRLRLVMIKNPLNTVITANSASSDHRFR